MAQSWCWWCSLGLGSWPSVWTLFLVDSCLSHQMDYQTIHKQEPKSCAFILCLVLWPPLGVLTCPCKTTVHNYEYLCINSCREHLTVASCVWNVARCCMILIQVLCLCGENDISFTYCIKSTSLLVKVFVFFKVSGNRTFCSFSFQDCWDILVLLLQLSKCSAKIVC